MFILLILLATYLTIGVFVAYCNEKKIQEFFEQKPANLDDESYQNLKDAFVRKIQPDDQSTNFVAFLMDVLMWLPDTVSSFLKK